MISVHNKKKRNVEYKICRYSYDLIPVPNFMDIFAVIC